MSTLSIPYFFDEALLASKARQPGEREKALNLTKDDLAWLQTVYVATQTARNSEKNPMQVDQVMLDLSDSAKVALAGSFTMSRPAMGEVTLYTPWKGLIKYADMAAVRTALKAWLAQDDGKRELLRYLPVEQRFEVLADSAPDISTQAIEGTVFAHQEELLEHNRRRNSQAMTTQLLQMPTLQSMLDETLKSACFKRFPGLDQRLTRMDSFTASNTADSQTGPALSSVSLSDALLRYYLDKRWPDGESRRFFNPAHGISNKSDNKAWEDTLQQIIESFTPRLESLLETFWNTEVDTGPSRRDFFVQCMTDAYHLDLLLKRQRGVLTTEQYLRLIKVSLASAQERSLEVEKIRVTALFRHYVELAGTFMISDRDAFGCLYSPARGIEITSNLDAIRTVVLQMLKSEGHEDNLLNFLSLEQRQRFLELTQQDPIVIGEPVVGPVFEQLLEDILDKQQDNLTFALNRYCESEGTLNPHALIDKALDVRGLIDDQLLDVEVDGRWSTALDHRWSAQPATVRAESAKEQLALLDSVSQATRQKLESLPAIPATISNVGAAQNIVKLPLQQLQADFSHLFATALRSELKLRSVSHTLGNAEQAIIKTVLDAPVKLQRAALNGFLPDAFTLALKAVSTGSVLKLASCFVLTERGGLDREHSGKSILWTPALGFEAFAALPALMAELQRRLQDPDDQRSLLENLGLGDRLPGLNFVVASMERVTRHVFDEVQKPFVRLDDQSVTRALTARLPAATLTRLLNLVAVRKPHTGLGRATHIAQSLTTRQKLPAWLAKASIADQILHAELLQQYTNHVEDDKDYLSDIPTLGRTAHAELEKQLKADSYPLDPDKIEVRLGPGPTSAASNPTLTQFALSHFKDLDNASFTLASLDGKTIPAALDENYVTGLIRKLELGRLHQAVLQTALAETHPDAAKRRKRFASQVPWQLMHYAHTEKLQERLSQGAFERIKQIIDMPDPIARADVKGANAIIRPLEIAGIKDQQTIQVPGVYLVGAKDKPDESQVLIAPYSPEHGVKEFDNEKTLLTALTSQGALRDWVLNRVPASDRALCKEHLSSTSSRSAALSLASTPFKGNVLRQLFKDNTALLTRLLGLQADSNAQGEWSAIKHVLGEDLQQAFSFFMGRLAYPITVWHSWRDIKQSAEDLQTHKWKAAIGEFISGIAQLASLRESTSLSAVAPATQSPVPENAAKNPFKWEDVKVTAPLRTRLSRFESTDIDLGSLSEDRASGVYTDLATLKKYAPVEGKVYPIKQSNGKWRITGDKDQGPRLDRNSSSQWYPALMEKPRMGLLNRWASALSVWLGMNVEAHGMPEIRRLFPVKARSIDEALDQATSYLWTAWRNLQLLRVVGGPDTPVHTLVKDFLGVTTIENTHVDMMEKAVGDLFAAMLDPTLRSPDSRRFAVGNVHGDEEHAFAFVVPGDQQRKIYLAERFFLPGFDHYRNYMTDPGFPIRAHARAATLIHELSHIVSKTEDIAYLDTSRPFHALIETTSPMARLLKESLSELQETELSDLTPLTRLFTRYNPDTASYEDLGDTSYEDTDAAYHRVLKLTGKRKLADARTEFMANTRTRLAVMLANADSLTWLVTHLGRELHVSTP